MLRLSHEQARIIDDNAIRYSLHDVLSLEQVPAGIFRQLVDAQKQSSVLNSEPGLLSKLLKEFNLFSRKAACTSMVYFDGTEHSRCIGVLCPVCADTVSQTPV